MSLSSARLERTWTRVHPVSHALLLALSSLSLAAASSACAVASDLALQTAAIPTPTSAAPTEDTALEDQLAHAFDQRRAAGHLHRLQRIRDRAFVRQLACTAAATGTPPAAVLAHEAQADSALVSIDSVEPMPAALARVADYDDRRTASGRKVARYSIAAFTSTSDPGQHWVALALYWSRFTEWFATRAGTYTRPPAASIVATLCREVR